MVSKLMCVIIRLVRQTEFKNKKRLPSKIALSTESMYLKCVRYLSYLKKRKVCVVLFYMFFGLRCNTSKTIFL